MKLKELLFGLVAGAGCLSGALAQQNEGNWMVRVRAVDVRPVEKWSDAGVLNRGGSDIYVKNKLIPEIDISYFFTKNIAAELILTYPQKGQLTSKTLGDLGNFKLLPPTLTLQYHFAPEATFRPYVGAGINYTRFSDEKLGGISLGQESWGGALQVGMDWKVGRNSYINLDLKKVYFNTDASLNGVRLGNATVDPVLIGVGYGFRF